MGRAPKKKETPQARVKFGRILKTLREARNLSLADLANLCGLDRGNLWKIESGQRKPPELPTLLRLASGLTLHRDSTEMRALLSAAARERFEGFEHDGVAYLAYENSLRGLASTRSPIVTPPAVPVLPDGMSPMEAIGRSVEQALVELGLKVLGAEFTAGSCLIQVRSQDGTIRTVHLSDQPASDEKAGET